MDIKLNEKLQKIIYTLVFCFIIITILCLVVAPFINHLLALFIVILTPLILGLILRRKKGYEIIGSSLIWTFWVLISLAVLLIILLLFVLPKGC